MLLVVLYGWLEYRHDKRRSGRRYFGEVALLRALPEAERDWYRANMALTRAVGQPVPS